MRRALISACLCGWRCRYNGKAFSVPHLSRLVADGYALPVCPEMMGALPCPRPPAEILGKRVMTREGGDVTEAFVLGAQRTLALALDHGIGMAVLKENSPSCGVHHIYDGSFEGRLVTGSGITAAMLAAEGFSLFTEQSPPHVYCALLQFSGTVDSWRALNNE